MLKITQHATAHLIRTRAERGFGKSAGARFVHGTAGVGLTFVPLPHNGDQVWMRSDISIYVARELVEELADLEIDEATDDRGSRLVIRQQGEAHP